MAKQRDTQQALIKDLLIKAIDLKSKDELDQAITFVQDKSIFSEVLLYRLRK